MTVESELQKQSYVFYLRLRIANILESDYELPPTTLSQRYCRCWVAVLVWVPLKKDQTVMSSQSFQHNHSDNKSHRALEQKVLKTHKNVATRLFKNLFKCLSLLCAQWFSSVVFGCLFLSDMNTELSLQLCFLRWWDRGSPHCAFSSHGMSRWRLNIKKRKQRWHNVPVFQQLNGFIIYLCPFEGDFFSFLVMIWYHVVFSLLSKGLCI